MFEMCWALSDRQVQLQGDGMHLWRQTGTIWGHSFLWAALADSCLPGERSRENFLKKITHTHTPFGKLQFFQNNFSHRKGLNSKTLLV